MPKINLLNIDCMDYMSGLDDNAFDLAIVDPPYGIDLANMNMGAGKSAKASKIENRKWKAKDWDKNTPSAEYFEELMRVSKHQIIWGGNYFELPPCYGYVIWDKQIPEGLSFADCEMAWTSIKRAAKIFSYSAYKDKKFKFHPTQKPIRLYTWLLANYAKEGDKILDTHVGSASSLIACHQLGYDVTGCELDEEYYKLAQQRIKEETAQLSLF